MKDISEEELHLYILNKTLLDKDTLNRIEELAAIDENFQKEIHEIEEFYSNYNSISSNIPDVYLLHAPEVESSGDKSIKLAAMQFIAESTDLTYIKTFFTGDNYLITRLFYNSKDQSYNLFIISEDDKVDAANAVLYLTGIKKEFVANEKGIIKIKSEFIDFPEQIIIRLALAKFDIIWDDLIQLRRKEYSYQNEKNSLELELVLDGNMLKGFLRDLKNITAAYCRIFLIPSGEEDKFISTDIENNKFSIQLPVTKNFIITVL